MWPPACTCLTCVRTSLVVFHAESVSLLVRQCTDQQRRVSAVARQYQSVAGRLTDRRQTVKTVERPAAELHVINAAADQATMTALARINQLSQRRARLVLGWVTVSGHRDGKIAYFAVGKCRVYVTVHEGKCPYWEMSIEGTVHRWKYVRSPRRQMGKPFLYVTSHPDQLSLAIPPWVGAMSTSESWDVNRHTVRCTSPVSVVW